MDNSFGILDMVETDYRVYWACYGPFAGFDNEDEYVKTRINELTPYDLLKKISDKLNIVSNSDDRVIANVAGRLHNLEKHVTSL